MSEPPGTPAQLVVRYQRGLGVAALVGGALLLVLGLGTSDVLNIVLGLILGGLGIGYAVGTAVVTLTTLGTIDTGSQTANGLIAFAGALLLALGVKPLGPATE